MASRTSQSLLLSSLSLSSHSLPLPISLLRLSPSRAKLPASLLRLRGRCRDEGRSRRISAVGFPADLANEMAALVAHQGRELQRYTEDGHRLVVGCIPYKFEWDRTSEHGIAIDQALQVLVVSAQKGLEMLFPRGGWKNDEFIEEATSREAMKEGGVLGDVEESQLKAARMHIYVRRGGPNYQTGLAKMRVLGNELSVPLEAHHMQQIFNLSYQFSHFSKLLQ